MTTNPSTLALTDDEVVALAARAGLPWPSPLPTVDVDNAGDMSNAALRGARSLMVRGLLRLGDDSGSLDPSVRVFADAMLGARSVLATFLVNSDMTYCPSGLTMTHYAGPNPGGQPAWVSEVVTPGGARYLALNDGETCVDATRRLLEVTVESGLEALEASDGQRAARYLCVTGPVRDETHPVVLAAQGSIKRFEAGVGQNKLNAKGTVGSVDEAMTALGIDKLIT